VDRYGMSGRGKIEQARPPCRPLNAFQCRPGSPHQVYRRNDFISAQEMPAVVRIRSIT
jgi:hypothetical protein